MAAILSQRYGRDRVTVVVSRSDRQADISPDQVERAIGCEVMETFPSDYRRALHALNKGRPLALDNHNELSGSLRRFAFRLAGIKPERPAAAGGLLGRLTSSRRS